MTKTDGRAVEDCAREGASLVLSEKVGEEFGSRS
jgi:hypothetical protein